MPAIVLEAATHLATETTAQAFHGSDHGVDVSFHLNHTAPGRGPSAHRHAYPEVFVIHAGEGTFTVDGETIVARGGQVVVVPAGAVHGFTSRGPGMLEMTSIHPVAEMKTEWVDER